MSAEDVDEMMIGRFITIEAVWRELEKRKESSS